MDDVRKTPQCSGPRYTTAPSTAELPRLALARRRALRILVRTMKGTSFSLPGAIAAALLLASCATPPPEPPPVPQGQSLLQGWRYCTGDVCGRTFLSAYSDLVFVRLDGKDTRRAEKMVVPPGPHWIEARYAWGGGIMGGVGNYRNYGFEFDFQPDRSYEIDDVPSGCVLPSSRRTVSAKTLQVYERLPTGQRVAHAVRALEYCGPSTEQTGSCRSAADCGGHDACTPFGGSTGFGLCASAH